MIIDWAYFASLSQQTNEFVTWDSRATILKLLISMFMRADISLLQHIDTLLTISLMVKILSASAVKKKIFLLGLLSVPLYLCPKLCSL